ncbi:uncharacterized protein N7515_006255 [Penicillium bovifimosum]|uniref:F-box domain-containing protein n=1 Tax=Penicillium bovifimosum TaxID=126998 RepID=A0A9W9GUM1_9EURO|nr:uncharacterized protein N7515_006255 [Penicillium bovifimosum]KAJ5130216.1 hypothetical protein N7515_006255 [Penicillium bovifimosum]
MADTSTSPPALPLELWGCIDSHLSNADIKSLRLTCKQFNNTVFLRLNRVFLSANPLNIEVFRNIASHDKFRHQVNEIIWDEARLQRGPKRTSDPDEGHELLSDEDEPDNNREWAAAYDPEYREEIIKLHETEEGDRCPRWFKNACEENSWVQKWQDIRDAGRSDHIARREQVRAQLSLGECWQHYLELLRQQKDVLAGQSDLEAFAFGVRQFPALKRVTITPAAHGTPITPLYPTPMIRVFPEGFNYPIPRGWLYDRDDTMPTAYLWNHYPELRGRYRGFRAAMRVLANEPNSVSELVMTSNSVPTGINCTIFDNSWVPPDAYSNFSTVLKKPGFRRLDIALLVSGQNEDDLESCWRSLLNGRLRRALGEAKEMEEFRLHTTFDRTLYAWFEWPLIPLQSIVPVEQWSKLRHFELSGFLISQDDCVSFLKTLPESVRSIELSMLYFHDDGNWCSMLEEIRRMVSEGTLWGDRDARSRPKITIGVPIDGDSILGIGSHAYGHGVWIEKEVEDFIYGEGGNPFKEHRPEGSPRPSIHLGVGVIRGAFEPDFEDAHDQWALEYYSLRY